MARPAPEEVRHNWDDISNEGHSFTKKCRECHSLRRSLSEEDLTEVCPARDRRLPFAGDRRKG